MPITIEELQQQFQQRRRFWQPARDRMDFWHLMVLLVDLIQMSKQPGLKRFVGAEPLATVTTARSILARNPLQPYIALRDLESPDELANSQQIEKMIIGAFNDMDRVLFGRGMQETRSIAALHFLIRGWAVGHLVLREDFEAKGMRTPIDYEPWDMRFFLPAFDRRGFVQSSIYESYPTWSELISDFPEMAAEGSKWQHDYTRQVMRLDWYDSEYHAVAVQTNYQASTTLWTPPNIKQQIDLKWAKEPVQHGLDRIPVVCMSANGLPFNNIPTPGRAVPPIAFDYGLPTNKMGRRLPSWLSTNAACAHWGRSILAAVEDLVPMYNETVSLLMQILYNDAFGTWFTNTHTGDLTELEKGGVNALRIGESVSRVAGISASADLYRLLAIVRDSYQRGTFSDVLHGLQAMEESGFHQTQIKNAAMNALDAFMKPYANYHSEVAQLINSQMKQAKGIEWEVWGRTNDLRQFRVLITSDAVDREWPIAMKPMPALPDDLALRVDIARRMLDPNMPLASYQTVLDRVLEFGDAQRERELMFEDMAERDPIIVFLRIRERLIARGLDELAEMFGDRAFSMAFLEEIQRMMMMERGKQAAMMQVNPNQAMQGGGFQGRPESAESPGASPENLPPEQAVGPTETPAAAAEPVL